MRPHAKMVVNTTSIYYNKSDRDCLVRGAGKKCGSPGTLVTPGDGSMGDWKWRVLLVDDEPSIIKTMGKRLEVEGYEVLVL